MLLGVILGGIDAGTQNADDQSAVPDQFEEL